MSCEGEIRATVKRAVPEAMGSTACLPQMKE